MRKTKVAGLMIASMVMVQLGIGAYSIAKQRAHVNGLFTASSSPESAKLKAKREIVTDLKDISLPKDHEVCFSPEEPCDLKLVKLIQSAEKSIDVAIFDVTRDQVVHALLVASKKVPVRVVADRRQAKGPHSLVPLLMKAGVQVKYGKQRGIMHHKFTLIDGKMLQTGSFNYTNHATEANHENQIYLSDVDVISKYQKHFNSLWDKSVLPTAESRKKKAS